MKSNMVINENRALEMIKELRKIRFNWQKHRFLKVDINSVGPDSKELSMEDMDAYRAYMRDPITESIFQGDSSPF
jgi:hypothetical protein